MCQICEQLGGPQVDCISTLPAYPLEPWPSLSNVPIGWQCPVCKGVYAPHISQCPQCPQSKWSNVLYSTRTDGIVAECAECGGRL